MQVKQTKDIPVFQNEDEEREFWATHSVLDFPDRFVRVDMDLSHLKRSTQSLMKILLAEKVNEELHKQL